MAEVRLEKETVAFLRQATSENLQWGWSDCAMTVFRFLADVHGQCAPRDKWICTYRDKRTANQAIRRAGGPLSAFADEMVSIAAKRTNAPVWADVGLIKDHAGTLLSAICLGDGLWVCRGPKGITYFRPKKVFAWTLGEASCQQQ